MTVELTELELLLLLVLELLLAEELPLPMMRMLLGPMPLELRTVERRTLAGEAVDVVVELEPMPFTFEGELLLLPPSELDFTLLPPEELNRGDDMSSFPF